MGIPEKIAELEAEYAKTQKNKRTEGHLGILKAKMAKLRHEYEAGTAGKGGGGTSAGFDVKKSGNATVVFIGLPSVGKSTMLNALTGSKSKIAAYAFTTLTCIPGVLQYKGAQIQLLDLPGIISGASVGKGRGREVLAVARNADLVLLILDVFDPLYRDKLIAELDNIGIRLDQKPADISIERAERGGLEVIFTIKPTKLDEKLVRGILKEYGIFNGVVIIRQDATSDQLIDKLTGNVRYVPSLTVVNKVDLVKPEFLKKIPYSFVPISANANYNIDKLKDDIYKALRVMRVYTRSRFEDADDAPLIVREGTTVLEACGQIHRDLKENFKFAKIWGPSAKHPGQRVGAGHLLKDGDVFMVETR